MKPPPPPANPGSTGQPTGILDPAQQAQQAHFHYLENISDRLNIMMWLLLILVIASLLSTWFLFTMPFR